MRKFFLLSFISIIPFLGYTQTSRDFSKEELFTILDTMPSYHGGEDAILQFFNENSTLNFTKEKQNGGMVSINFIVSKEGQVYEPKILFNSTKELGAEVSRLVLLTQTGWKPGIRKGKNVNVSTNLVVYIKQ